MSYTSEKLNTVMVSNILYVLNSAKNEGIKTIGHFVNEIETLMLQRDTPESNATFSVYLSGTAISEMLEDDTVSMVLVRAFILNDKDKIKAFDVHDITSYYHMDFNKILTLPITVLSITRVVV